MSVSMQELLMTMRSALAVSAVCILLYILWKRMSMSMRKSETQVGFALVDRFESSIQNGMLNIAFHVPEKFKMPVEVVLLSEEGGELATLQQGVCGPGRHARSCEVGPWTGRCVLVLRSKNQRLERYMRFDR
tara:strand:- start:2558 stop:2953 length:396 start_codon:yes stop_codon:yes gene_type:complete